MPTKSCLRFLIVCFLTCTSALAAEKPYGTLPPGSLSVSELSGISAEIARDHIFDPAKYGRRLPTGYRFISLEEYAKEDPAVADFLKANPQYARYAVGSFAFMSAGLFNIDGVRIHPAGTIPMAFWWARVEGPRDARMRGKVQWVQLASWYSRDLTERTQILATDPTAEFTDIQVNEEKPGVWRVHLKLSDEVIDGEIRCSGELKKRKATGEQFMSVLFSGESAAYFWVITYFGHHHRHADGEWHSKGSGVFSAALQIPNEATVFQTGFQSSWSALSGLYQTKP